MEEPGTRPFGPEFGSQGECAINTCDAGITIASKLLQNTHQTQVNGTVSYTHWHDTLIDILRKRPASGSLNHFYCWS